MIVSERRQALAGAIGVSLGDVEELIDKAEGKSVSARCVGIGFARILKKI